MDRDSSPSDLELVHRLKAGDRMAFPELVRRYEGKVYRLAFKMVRNLGDAQDILQEVFLAVFAKLGDFEERSSFSSWIYRITVNAALMRLRSQRILQTESLEEHLPKFSQDGMHLAPIPDWARQPEDILLS